MNITAKSTASSLRNIATRMASSFAPPPPPPPPPPRQKVAILGSGWAGYALAKNLDPQKYERILISPRSYFVFTPLLASTSVGTLEFRSVLEPVRRLGVDKFHQGWADDIDFARKRITVEANAADELSGTHGLAMAAEKGKGKIFDVKYDKLIIAVGAYSQTFGTKGVREHANFLRDVTDARKIRLKVLGCFERAAQPNVSDELRQRLLHFAVVGGGPTGIEFAAELHDLVHEDLVKLYPDLIKFVGITVYDVAPKVLPMFDKELAGYAMDLFKRQGIVVKTEHHLQGIRALEDGSLALRVKETGDGEVGAGVVVWSTGLMQNPLVGKLLRKEFSLPDHATGSSGIQRIKKHERTGAMITDPHLRIQLVSPTPSTTPAVMPDVFAIGDCSSISGQNLPATAQVASQQAVYLAKRLNKGDLTQQKFKFRNWGTMAYLGSWRAIHQSSADELKGWAAWVLWRTAYLTKSMSVRNKIMVPVYWVMTWIFGRDISRF